MLKEAANPHFIQQATAHAHGQFRAKAKKAGMTTEAFAHHVMANPDQHDSTTRHQAQLALTLMGLSRKR